MGLLQATAEPAREILAVERIDVVADSGYFRAEDIEACEKAGLHALRAPTAARLLGERGSVSQGRVCYDTTRDAMSAGRSALKPIRHGGCAI